LTTGQALRNHQSQPNQSWQGLASEIIRKNYDRADNQNPVELQATCADHRFFVHALPVVTNRPRKGPGHEIWRNKVTISKIQKTIILIGAAALITSCLFPPWVYTFKNERVSSEEPAGYSLILDPPARRNSYYAHGVKIDISRISLQFFAILISTGVGVFASIPRKKGEV